MLLGAASGASPPTAVRAAIAYCNKFAEALAYHESRQHCVFLKDSECVTSSLWSTLVRGDVLTDDGSTIVSDGDLIAIQRLLADAGAMWPELCTQGGPVTAPIRNVWIVKPTHLSKGEGIRVFDDAMQAVAYAGELAYDVIAQKYIERPLCVAGKKVIPVV